MPQLDKRCKPRFETGARLDACHSGRRTPGMQQKERSRRATRIPRSGGRWIANPWALRQSIEPQSPALVVAPVSLVFPLPVLVPFYSLLSTLRPITRPFHGATPRYTDAPACESQPEVSEFRSSPGKKRSKNPDQLIVLIGCSLPEINPEQRRSPTAANARPRPRDV